MRIRRIGAVVGVAAVAALVLSGCSAPGLDKGTSVGIAWDQPFYSYNGAASFGNAAANNNIISMTNDWFNSYDNTPRLVKNTSFGHYEVVARDPLTVKYTVNDGVKWSDGTRVDAADLLLDWAANSRSLDTANFDASRFINPGTGAVTRALPKGVVYFDTGAQPNSGLGLVHDVPTVGDDGRSITMVYSAPNVDWELAFPSALPAHVVAKNALGLTDDAAAKRAVIAAIRDKDPAALAKISAFWNSGFNFTTLPRDRELYIGTGPYTISAFRPNKDITLTANPAYTGNHTPSIEKVTVRFIGDPLTAVQALRDGAVDVVSGQATPDLVKTLGAVKNTTVVTGAEGTYEHVDLQFGRSKSGVFDDPRVREAFLKIIPRQQILDKLIKPIAGGRATLRDSQVIAPGAEGYDSAVKTNGSARYDAVDVTGAKALLAKAGVARPGVCLLYESNNPRRVKEFRLIQASGARAGFNVTDCGSDSWNDLLGTPNAYDASIFGWPLPSLAAASSGPTFQTGGANNLNFFSNRDVDALVRRLNVEYDPTKQRELQQRLDKVLWDSSYGVTLFQFPGVTAFNKRIEGVSPSILAPTIFWNVWDWKVAGGS